MKFLDRDVDCYTKDMSGTLATSIKSAVETLKSQRAPEVTPPSQLFMLRITKKVDPIFTPRNYPYDEKVRKETSTDSMNIDKAQQELAYIRSLAPFTHLPLSLVPTDLEPYPPLMQFGWMISDSLKEQLYRCADSQEQNYVKRHGLTRKSETLTFEIALDHLLKGLELSWSNKESIRLVLTNSSHRATPLFTLYSNHELYNLSDGNLPSQEDIEKIRSFFQITESPNWYPTVSIFEWGDRPLY